ncbi:nitroreductase family deazaflavin-dependent oxidoreductase [Streptomyces sp. SID13031]|uniref:nitroreductase family deazaflavin-dependent oxidoreductase n=1 Tax=Streptomyces sp. SID13031 TaxID=2706046 RepID=UPI0013CC8F11|nr:nitroreductase family deazaflavin-dependent oxidoreductase [Streptomyces sp. SID13031]NEA37003.1 nitroreductase family deazaflavin-dependent oxidoreductase [Streptomyces sp. SID13031]
MSSSESEYAPSPTDWVRTAVEKIEAAGDTKAGQFNNGQPVVLLTMRGAKSGKIRKVPLMRVEHEGVYAAVASLGGAPKHPVWYYNLQADPKIQLQDGEQTGEYVAREIEGEEYKLWWERSVEAFPNYAEYQTKTTRIIPLFLLEPASN